MAKKKETIEDIEEAIEYIGQSGVIGLDAITEAEEVLRKYKQGKVSVETRIIENEKWWKLRHWEVIKQNDTSKSSDPQPTSAWLFNSLANKHADAMDNYPSPNILPRDEDDKKDAETLSKVIPITLERNDYEQVYSDAWWYKLKNGTSVYGVFWDNSLDNGLGDVRVTKIDVLNFFWEPGIEDIQDSRNIFHIGLMDNDILEGTYEFLKGKLGGGSIDKAEYQHDDNIDNTDKTIVVDWYYKKQVGQSTVLHYCKFVSGSVIYASENDPEYAETGFYSHGKYPFVTDTLFKVEGSPVGFGYIDVMKDPQMYIDKLNQLISKNAMMAGRKRWFYKDNIDVNMDEFADWSKDFVRVTGNMTEDNLREIDVKPLPSFIINYMQMKVDELKETSGNRDFSQGSTAAGVTAASAIAALQEAGSKLSRDMIKGSYRAFQEVNYLVLELIRQFYTEPRHFRFEDNSGEEVFQVYDNSHIRDYEGMDEMTGEAKYRRPIFDIKISAQKQSPFNRIAQNELAKEMYSMGWFSAQQAESAMIAIDMMEFEGKEGIKAKIQENSQLMQDMNRLVQVAGQIGADMGVDILGMAGIGQGESGPMPMQAPKEGGAKDGESESTIVSKARERVASSTVPKI